MRIRSEFDSDSDSNSLGSESSDRISFFYCRIGSDFVGFLSDRIWVFSCIASNYSNILTN